MPAQQVSLEEALAVIQRECYLISVQVEEKEAELNSLQQQVLLLESDNRRYKTIISNQNKRIAMLERVIITERMMRSDLNYDNNIELEGKSLDCLEIDAEKQRQQARITSLCSDLRKQSKELALLIPGKQSSQRSKSNEEASDSLLKFLITKSTSQKDSKSKMKKTSTILDSLSPTTKNPAPSMKKGRRCASDNSVKLSTEPKKRSWLSIGQDKSQNATLQNLVEVLEDDTFLDDTKEPGTVSWKQMATCRAHFDGIRSIEFHKTQPILISASDDCTVKLWNINSSTKKTQLDSVDTFYGHNGAILKCAMNFDCSELFTASLDHTIMHWQFPEKVGKTTLSSGTAISNRLQILQGHSNAVWDICTHHSDKRILFSASSDGTVKLWNSEKKIPCIDTFSHSSGNSAIIPTSINILQSDPTKLLIAFNNSSITLLDIETCKIINEIEASNPVNRSTQINKIISHPTNGQFFSGKEDRKIMFYDIRTFSSIHSIIGHLEGISSLAIDPTGLHIISGSHDSSLRFWDLNHRNCVQELMANQKKFDEAMQCIAVSPISKLIACSGADSNIKLFTPL